MNRTIYHGSKDIITTPEYGLGKKYNDYGLGFYCTENLELAKEWAVSERDDGYVNQYTIDEKGLNIIRLAEPAFTVLHWIELLLCNRIFDLTTPLARESVRYLHANFHVSVDDADILIGFRADDSYFSYAQDFINGAISCGQLRDAMRLGDLGMQYVLVSPKAFEHLIYEKHDLVSCREWYPRKKARDTKARRDYCQMDIMKYIRNDLYMIQILDQEVKTDDPRLR